MEEEELACRVGRTCGVVRGQQQDHATGEDEQAMVKIMGQKTCGGSPVPGFLSWLPVRGLSASKEDAYFPCRAGEKAAVSLRVHTSALSSESLWLRFLCAGQVPGIVCLRVQSASHLPGREKFISVSASILHEL